MAILVVATAHAAAPEDAYSACRVPAGDGPTARPGLWLHRAAPEACLALGEYQWLKQTMRNARVGRTSARAAQPMNRDAVARPRPAG